MRLKIEELLDVNCFDIYGLCEVTGPGVALECIHHNGMHVYEDYFYPEVLNPLITAIAQTERSENWYLQHLPKKVCRYFVTEPKTLQVLIILPVNVDEHSRESQNSKDVPMI